MDVFDVLLLKIAQTAENRMIYCHYRDVSFCFL